MTRVNFFSLLLILSAIMFLPVTTKAQVTIGGTSDPQSFSILELISNDTRGFRLPQLTEYQRDNHLTPMLEEAEIDPVTRVSPAMGLTIFNTCTRCVDTWNGRDWVSLCYGNELATGFSLLPESYTLVVGETLEVTVVVEPEGAHLPPLVWESSVPANASVNESGVVTGLGVGNTLISARAGNLTSSNQVNVTVVTPVAVTSVAANPRCVSLFTLGQTRQLGATVLPENATNRQVTWESSNPTVLSITPDGLLTAIAAGEATITVRSVSNPNHTATLTAFAEFSEPQANFNTEELENPITMIFVQGGCFFYQSRTENPTDGTHAGTQPSVNAGAGTLTTVSSFFMSETPVTRAQYIAVMGAVTTNTGDPANVPIRSVTWFEAISFVNRLSLLEGRTPVYSVVIGGQEVDWLNITHAAVATSVNANSDAWHAVTQDLSATGFRLPTEHEWEYAARGGQLSRANLGIGLDYYYSGSNDVELVAWFSGNSGDAQPVRGKSPNALGLYDMSGNVFEWCWDDFSVTLKLFRGGSWNSNADFTRVSQRTGNAPTMRANTIGFRLVASAQ